MTENYKKPMTLPVQRLLREDGSVEKPMTDITAQAFLEAARRVSEWAQCDEDRDLASLLHAAAEQREALDQVHSWVMRWQNHLACNGFQDASEELGMILTGAEPWNDPGGEETP